MNSSDSETTSSSTSTSSLSSSSSSTSTSSTSSTTSISSSSSLSARKGIRPENMKMFTTKTRFYKTYCDQAFSLPDSIMDYMVKNPPSAAIYLKMIKTCKYFFCKNPILVLSELEFNTDGHIHRWLTRINDGEYDGLKTFDLNNISSKLWITGPVWLRRRIDLVKTAALLFSKIYRWDAKSLNVYKQKISYDELIAFSSVLKDLELQEIKVKYEDGSNVSLQKIIESFPKLTGFEYAPLNMSSDASAISSKTFKELLKIPHFLTLETLSLWYIPESFDIESFYNYMKENKRTKIELVFCDTLSDEYKARLDAIVTEVLEAENYE